MPNKTKETTQRVPRPKGFTFALNHYHQTNNKEVINKLKQLTVEQWTMNNYKLNGQTITISQLAEYINESIAMTMKMVNSTLTRFANLFDGNEEKGQWARAQIFGTLFGALEARSLASKQADILMAHQGQEYKPFVSGEVNRAIANLLSANKPIIEILKMISDKAPQPLVAITNTTNENKTVNYITADQALQMIQSKSIPLLEDEASIDALIASETSLPNVDARTQDLREIGIKTVATEGLPKPAKSSNPKPNPATVPQNKNKPSKASKSQSDLEIEDEDEYRM